MARVRIALLITLTALALGAGCGGGPEGGGPGGQGGGPGAEEEEPGPERRVLVEAAPAAIGAVADHLVTSGTLDSDVQADIVPEANGLITQVLVEEGATVSAGQLLAVLANPSLDANADRASIELQRVRQALAEAERLHSQGAVSDGELRTARNSMAAAEASFQEARRSRGFTRITSPISGTLTVRDVRVGELATSAKRAFQVVDLSRLRVVVQLPEKDLPRVRIGQKAVLEGAYNESARATATVERVAPAVDATTGTVKVTIRLDPEQSSLLPGQFVKVRLEVDRREGVLTIPRRALVYDEGEPVTWRVIDAPPPKAEEPAAAGEGAPEAAEEGPGLWEQITALLPQDEATPEGEEGQEPEKDPWDGIPKRTVEKVRLKIGFTDADFAEVQEGVAAGDLVVTVGNNNLRAETLVKLDGDADPPPTPPGEGGEDQGGGGRRKGKRGGGFR